MLQRLSAEIVFALSILTSFLKNRVPHQCTQQEDTSQPSLQ